MTSLQDPTLVYDVAFALLSAAEQALVDVDATMPERMMVVPGNPLLASWDNCCGGQMIVGLEELYVFTPGQFPLLQLAPTPCGGAGWAARYLLQIARCHQSVDETQADDVETPYAPTAAYLGTLAAQTLTDAWAITRGVRCWLGEVMDDDDDFYLGALTPNGPNGNCVGYDLRVTVNLGEGCPCPVVPPGAPEDDPTWDPDVT